MLLSIMGFMNICSATESGRTRVIDKIVYRFTDASVPPQYHRSYTVTATSNDVRVVVDSYGDIVADRTFGMSERKMQVLVQSLDDCGIESTKAGNAQDECTGGTSRSIRIFSEGTLLMEGTVHNCGGRFFGNLSGDLECFERSIQGIIPDFSRLLE